MKKSIAYVIPVALALAFAGTVSAEETTSGTADVKVNVVPKPLLIKERINSKTATATPARDALRVNALKATTSAEKREAVKEKIDEKRKAQIREIAARTIKRLEAAVERLAKLSDRLESRLNKLSEGGVDVSKSRGLLTEARAKIAEAKSKIAEAKASIETAVSSDSPKEAFQKVREITGGANEKLKEAHKALVRAISSASAKGGLKKATTTPTTTNTESSETTTQQ